MKTQTHLGDFAFVTLGIRGIGLHRASRAQQVQSSQATHALYRLVACMHSPVAVEPERKVHQQDVFFDTRCTSSWPLATVEPEPACCNCPSTPHPRSSMVPSEEHHMQVPPTSNLVPGINIAAVWPASPGVQGLKAPSEWTPCSGRTKTSAAPQRKTPTSPGGHADGISSGPEGSC